ncbi:MAG: ABC-F family ATP-binding cassette domain-containing protein [Chloroflexota bacterium]
MSVLTASNLSKSFGATEIFSDISVEIPRGARTALVGPNGAGKTTLLHILIGEQSATTGEVQAMKGLRVGFLPQRPELLGDHSLREEAMAAFAELQQREAELAQLEEQMAAGDEDALERYGPLQEKFEADGGYIYPDTLRSVLKGLGFREDQFDMPLTALSGGQKTRAVLARLLLEKPDLLALDEPTNHLDIDAVEWLEGYLTTFEGAVLAISHDRYFIDAFANTVWELEWGTLETYRANYTQYIQQRTERRERLQKEFEAQRAFIAKEEDYIKRNIAGQNTRQAQGRRKRLDRLKRDNLISGPEREKDTMRFQMEINHRGNEYVLEADDLKVGYPESDTLLLEVQDIKLERGEIAALIGPNGVGKSTFIKTITRQLPAYDGDVTVGDKVELGYFAQAHETLNPDNTVIDEIIATKHMPLSEARSYLARYLFRGDDPFRKIGSLSGGERGRVALAKLALGTANLLLLDEPTNHLDIPSQEVLENMLTDYPGTALIISHDRYLVDALATQVWVARPAENGRDTGHVTVFKGSYTEYVQARRAQEAAQQEAEARARAAEKAKTAEKSSNGKSANGTSNKKHGLNPFQLKKRIAEVEQHIEALEQKLEQITVDLEAASAAGNAARVHTLGEAYTQAEADLEAAMDEWALLAE